MLVKHRIQVAISPRDEPVSALAEKSYIYATLACMDNKAHTGASGSKPKPTQAVFEVCMKRKAVNGCRTSAFAIGNSGADQRIER